MSESKQTPAFDQLWAAVSILQSYVLAGDTLLSGRGMWGSDHVPTLAIEEAIRLIIAASSELEPSNKAA